MSGLARVVVHPPSSSGGRRVTAGAENLGVAYGVVDVIEFLRRAGVASEDMQLEDPELIDWRGGGPAVWSKPGEG
ncbi:hypothetical protein [Streptomyces roseoverticillatus]|uniref:Uncharacterized protein n=1 Tax=Streptomyces roseoverticillatus TaxID=66429 RepID=A0ABV3IM80_9ACTN